MNNKLKVKIKSISKKTLCGILSTAFVLSSISTGLIIASSANYIGMPSLSEYHVMPAAMSNDAALFSKFDNAERYFYPTPHDSIIEVRDRKPGLLGLGAVRVSWRGSYYSSGYGHITSVLINAGPNYGLLDKKQFESRMLAYGSIREEMKRHLTYSENPKYLGQRDSGWEKYGKATIDLNSNVIISDIMVLTRDAIHPTQKTISTNVNNDVPYLKIGFSEALRVSAANTVDAETLQTMKLRIVLVPRNNQSATPTVVTARATEFSGNEKFINFELDNTDENQKLYKEISDNSSHKGHRFIAEDKAAGIEWVGFEDILDKEWKIIYVNDISEYASYPVQTTAGVIDGYNVSLPLTDMAGNQISLYENWDLRRNNCTLDTVNPVAAIAQMSGSSIKAEGTQANPEADEWPKDIERADLFSGMGPDGKGDTVDADIIMSETVKLAQGKLSDIKLEWSIKDAEGNPITTPLVSIDSHRQTVNSDIVSKLNFEGFTITKDMQTNGMQIKPVRIINISYISDMTGNKMEPDTENEKFFKPVISHQTFLDIKGPTVEIAEDGIFKVNDSNYTPASEDEAYFIIGLDISDSKVTGDGDTVTYGSGITADIPSYVGLTSYDGAPNITYQYQMSKSPDYISGTLEQSGTIGTDSAESQFIIPAEGVFYMHLKMYPEAGTEISDEQGITAQFKLKDAKGNESNIGVPLVELGLDDKAPVITNLFVKDLETLTVTAQAKDVNKISRFEYQWTENDVEPAPNKWTMLDLTDKIYNEPSFDINYGEDFADSYFDKTLHINVFDSKENSVSKSIRVTADFEKRNPQYKVNSNIDVPSASHSITIQAPFTKQTGTTGGYTRATVVSGDKTYVRSIKLEGTQTAELFDLSAQWYEVTVSDGKYTSVKADVTPEFNHYGYITADFAASSSDLTPVQGGDVTPSNDLHFSTTQGVVIANAPARNDVHSVEPGKVYAADESELKAITANGYTYYEVNRTLNGIRYTFTLNNALVPEWERVNVDFNNSYAVLLKTDSTGNLDTAKEISERYSLGSSSNQSFTLTEKDKDGKLYETGAYIFKVVVTQKDGDTQEFILGNYIVLDNSVLPEIFGVREYTRTVAATYQDSYNGPIVETITAEDGEVLNSIDISVAKPDNHTHISELETVKKDGNPLYVIEHQNALPNGTSYPSYIRTNIVAQYEGVNILGKDIGKVKGMRYWNKAQPGDYESLEYSVNYATDTQAEVYISNYFGWYDESSENNLVTAEELAQTDVSEFRTTFGSNTICYQLIMENGKESPVYTFEINLFDHQIDMNLEYEFGPSVELEVLGYNYDENGEYYDYKTKKQISKYVDVYVTDAYSPVGGLKLYHSKYDDFYNTWEHTEITDTENPIRLTLDSDGYEGSDSTRTDITGTPKCWEFITLVDAVGTAVTAYPILSSADNTEDNLYPYGINPETGTMTVDYYNNSYSTVGTNDYITHKLVFNKESGASIEDVVDSISVQIDDNSPVTLNTNEGNDIVYGANSAGIVKFQNGYFSVGNITYSYRDMVEFVFPYDPSIENGATVDHTVTVCGYLDGEEVYTKTFNVSAENTAPSLELNAPYLGENRIYANTYLTKTPDSTEYYNYSKNIYEAFYADGDYTIEAYDKYGARYELPLTVSGLPSDPIVNYSNTNPTAEPVTITVTTQAGTLTLPNSLPEGWSAKGTNTAELVLTATKNAENVYVDCVDSNGEYISYVNLRVNNIYPDEIVPEIEWQYNKYNVNNEDNTYVGEIKAVLVDKNGTTLTDPKTGVAPSFVFVPGGVTEYTFSGYKNIAGVTGPDFKAVLPVKLVTAETSTTESDTYTPDIAITGFAIYSGSTQPIEAAYVKSDKTRPEDANIVPADYSSLYGEKVYDDIDLLLREIGWADSYVLNVNVLDENSVKLFITEDVYAAVPDYNYGKSDTVDGVSLVGRTLEISKNTSFALHAVDKKGNSSSIHFNTTTLGATAPEPNIVQVLTKTGDEVRVYVLPPNMEGVTNLTITSNGAKTETDTESLFCGYQYMSYTENEKVVITYFYNHAGATHKGSIELDIVQIDKSVPSVQETKWSSNYDASGNRMTNQDITVQMKLNKAISDIYPVDAEGTRLLTPDGINISYLENRVTVVYEKNAPEITLKVVPAINRSLVGYINLPEIKTVDKTPAEVTATTEYAENRRNAVVTFTSDEDVVLQSGGKKNTVFTEKLTKDGIFTYNFIDLAGNVTEVEVEIKDLVTEDLTLVLATEKNDSSIIDPEIYNVDIGDILYAKTNRAATITVNGIDSKNAPANTWVAVEIKEDSEGLYPIIKANDNYGNTAIVQMLRIPIKDRNAPDVIVKKNLVSASIDLTKEQLDDIIRENIMVSDDVTPSDKLNVKFDYNIGSNGGKYLVTCTVSDENNNETRRMFWIRVYDGKEMTVRVNGEIVEKDETIMVTAGEQKIEFSFTGEPYKVVYKPGIKTAGQMKTGSTPVTQGYTDKKENTTTLDFKESGYYSFLVTTQSNETFRFVLYVQ